MFVAVNIIELYAVERGFLTLTQAEAAINAHVDVTPSVVVGIRSPLICRPVSEPDCEHEKIL